MDRFESSAHGIKLIAAFGAVYFIWGSTFLAIRYAIETLPPLFMMGARSLTAGAVLYAYARLQGAAAPTLKQWRSAAVAGLLLFLVGHGGLAWSEQRLTSGVAALVSSTTPLWIILLLALKRERAFTGRVVTGLLLGFGGVALLAGPTQLLGGVPADAAGIGVLLLADVAWATGSIYSRGCAFPRSPSLTAGTCLLSGGLALLFVSNLSGEALMLESVSPRSLAALLYLIAFGSIVTFAAYTWLLRVTSPARVATHSFVNPCVAVFIGWAIGGEPLGGRTLLAALAMVVGAATIVSGGGAGAGSRAPRSLARLSWNRRRPRPSGSRA